MKYYASLTGPLLGLYYPIPDELDNRLLQGAAMNSSKLKSLWHSIYPSEEVDRQIQEYGGMKLPDQFAQRLDYDLYKMAQLTKGAVGTRPLPGPPDGL